MEQSITVVVPTLNEEASLGDTLANLTGTDILEVIVVDGGSHDSTVPIAVAMGARVVRTHANRGHQQNLGAEHARGGILLFLHADTTLSRGFPGQVRWTLGQPGVSAGAFRLRIDSRNWRFRLAERAVAIRCRLFQLPYGDQGIFLRQETFRRAGGFAEMEVMEDFDLIRRLKELGRVKLANGYAATSARRWRREGFWRLTLIHQLRILAYLFRHLGRRPLRMRAGPG